MQGLTSVSETRYDVCTCMCVFCVLAFGDEYIFNVCDISMSVYLWQPCAQDHKIALDVASNEKVREEIWKYLFELQVSTIVHIYR